MEVSRVTSGVSPSALAHMLGTHGEVGGGGAGEGDGRGEARRAVQEEDTEYRGVWRYSGLIT